MSDGLSEIPESTITADANLTCGRCGDDTGVPLDETDTWHEVECSTCGFIYAIVFRLEGDR